MRTHILPRLLGAADTEGWPSPRSVVMLPTTVPDQRARVASDIDAAFAVFTRQSSYQKVMARENATVPSQVSIVGTTQFVADEVGRLGESGVTDFVAIPFGYPDERARTIEAVLSR